MVQCRTLVVAFNHANDILRASTTFSTESWGASVFIPGLTVRGNKVDPLHPENKSCQVFQVGHQQNQGLCSFINHYHPMSSSTTIVLMT